MKRLISLTILAALILGLLTGCGSEAKPEETPETTETITTPAVSGITSEEILDNFEKLMSDPKLTDDYTFTLLSGDEIAGTGVTDQWLVITDTLLGYNYMVGVFADSEGNVYHAQVSTDNTNTEYIGFSLFSYYLYKAMGFPELDAEEFYDTFDLVSREPNGSRIIGGWRLSAELIDDYLTFAAIYKAQ